MTFSLRKSAVLGATVAFGLVGGVGGALGADPKSREDLRPIVAEYVESGDIEKALAALKAKKATPQELVATLRTTPRFEEMVGGERNVPLKDGHGTASDLEIVAPATSSITRAKQGVGLLILLHGIKGNGRQIRFYAEKIVASHPDVVCIAPSAQPPSEAPEDGIPASLSKTFPHWWMYASPKSIPMTALRMAKKMFPIDHDRVVLCGASMGGYGAWNIGARHCDRWAGVAPLCGGITRLSQVGMKDDKTWALLENTRLYPMFAAHGDKDGVVPYQPDKDAADHVKELGCEMKFHTLEGVGHDLKEAMLKGTVADELEAFCTSRKRNSHPAKVTVVSADERNDGAFWLRIAKRAKGPDYARMEAAIDKAHNAVVIAKSSGVETARIYLDDKLLDLSKTVTVLVGDDVKWKGKPTPELKAALESWKSREDEKLVFGAFVDVDLK